MDKIWHYRPIQEYSNEVLYVFTPCLYHLMHAPPTRENPQPCQAVSPTLVYLATEYPAFLIIDHHLMPFHNFSLFPIKYLDSFTGLTIIVDNNVLTDPLQLESPRTLATYSCRRIDPCIEYQSIDSPTSFKPG